MADHRPATPGTRRGTALTAAALALAAVACRPPAPPILELAGASMGTTWSVKAVPGPGVSAAAIRAAVERELDLVDSRMSTYREDSELEAFNRHPDPTPFAISDETREVLEVALDVHRRSRGALDVTVGPLVDAWGFGPAGETTPPDDAELAELRQRVGHGLLELTDVGLVKHRPDLEIDLSAVAKGFAVDRVAAALDGLGLTHTMVEVGGEVRTRGTNAAGAPWRIGIERPQLGRGGAVERVVPLAGWAMATSGDYRNYREVDGVRLSHLIDPRSGRPIAHRLASVSVLDRRCAVADAWATALIVLGPEEGWEVAREEGLAAVFLAREDDGFGERLTPAFEEYLAGTPGYR